MFEFLASDPRLTALANVGGFIGFLIMIYQAVKLVGRFLKNAYHKNVRSAIRRQLKRYHLIALWCALDMHNYVSYLVRSGMFLILSLFMILSINAKIDFKDRDQFIDDPPKISMSYEEYVQYVNRVDDASFIISSFMIIVIFYMSMRILTNARLVSRIRRRWRRRGHIPMVK
jgi:hypothetical protein